MQGGLWKTEEVIRLVTTNKHTIAYEKPLVKGRGKFFGKPNGGILQTFGRFVGNGLDRSVRFTRYTALSGRLQRVA